jgi:phospholipid transport system substrate-binding protein
LNHYFIFKTHQLNYFLRYPRFEHFQIDFGQIHFVVQHRIKVECFHQFLVFVRKSTILSWGIGAALTVALLVAWVLPAAAAAPTERVQGFFADVNRVIGDPTYDDRREERLGALRRLVVDFVDFRDAAAIALGGEWAARTRGEREEFVRLFSDLLQTSVFAAVGSRARVADGLTVTYIGELRDRDGVTVATTVLTRSGSEMGVGYRMASRDGRWRVYDVVVDGVSLVENYRAQFQKVIQRSSYAELVSEMRDRLAEIGRAAIARAPAAADTAASVAVSPAPAVAPSASSTALPRAIETIASRSAVSAAVAPTPVPPSREKGPAGARARIALGAAGASGYWVQVGAFRSAEAAERVAIGLRDQAVALLASPGARPLLRVLVGPFRERDDAVSKLREIRARGYDAFIALIAAADGTPTAPAPASAAPLTGTRRSTSR